MSGEARDFSNIESRADIKCTLHGKSSKDIHSILIETLGKNASPYATLINGWSRVNVLIFPPVLRLVLDNQNSEHPRDYNQIYS
jgi:hypothetical protein